MRETVSKTILVVEDERSVAQMLRDLLEADGHRVLVESDGEWGLRTFESKPIDIVVLDVLVPKLVGFDLVHRLRETDKGRNVPIIVLSGVYRASVHRSKMMEKYNILEYFDKPVDAGRFIYAVREASKAKDLTADLPERTEADPSAPPTEAPGEAQAPEPIPTPRPSHRGHIEQIPFARLLGLFYAAKATGALMLRRGAIKKIVYLTDGLPVFVKSNLVSECLGRVMVRDRLITEGECESSVQRVKQEGRRQGQILIEMGCISPHNLQYGLERQMEIKLYDLFAWTEGKYLFTESRAYDGPEIGLTMSPVEMMFEGVRRTMSSSRVYRDLAHTNDLLVGPSDDPTFRYQALQLEPRSESLLDAVNGTRTLEQLLDLAEFPRADASVLLYVFTNTGLLQLLTDPQGVHGRPPDLRRTRRPSPAPATSARTEPAEPPLTKPTPSEDIPPLEAIARARQKAREAAEVALRSAKDALRGVGETADEVLARTGDLTAPPNSTGDLEDHTVRPTQVTDEVTSRGGDDGLSRPTLEAKTPPTKDPSDVKQTFEEEEEEEEAPFAALTASTLKEAEAQALVSSPSKEPDTLELAAPSQDIATDVPAGIDFERERARMHGELLQQLASLESKTLYERLGVRRRASPKEITRAFRDAGRAHHPDHLLPPNAGRATRSLAERVYVMVRRAHETLVNDKARAAYERQLAENAEGPTAGVARASAAEQAYAEGVEDAEAGDWEAARACFGKASEHNPGEGAYIAHLAWASFCASPDNEAIAQRSLADLDAAIDRRPFLEDAYVFQGLILEKLGLRDEAIRSLRKAIDVNADCVRALRALKAIEPTPPRRTGFFARLSGG